METLQKTTYEFDSQLERIHIYGYDGRDYQLNASREQIIRQLDDFCRFKDVVKVTVDEFKYDDHRQSIQEVPIDLYELSDFDVRGFAIQNRGKWETI